MAPFGQFGMKEQSMLTRIVKVCALALVVCVIAISSLPARATESDGIVLVKSAYPMSEAIRRLKSDIADKKLMFFMEIDQSKLAAEAGIALRPSTLLIFGNPQLGTQFMTSNPSSGLDWPVRLLVFQDQNGTVWAAYTDFAWIALRHRITDRDTQFKMASMVIESITSSAKAK
jgi:uncharacterized protein (DUF302 family)